MAVRFSDRGCSRSLELAVGTARHQLGQTAAASLWPFQLRLRYRSRFFFVGVRAAGKLGQTASWTGASVNVASYTAAFGLELASKRFQSALLAFAASAEVGFFRFRERDSGAGCTAFGPCGDPSQSQGTRATYGARLALRLEIPVRVGALLVDVEGAWTRGLMISSFHDALTGLGGGQISFLMGVAFGAGGES